MLLLPWGIVPRGPARVRIKTRRKEKAMNENNKRFTVLVSQNGVYFPYREQTTDSLDLAMVVAKDETSRILIEGMPEDNIHERVEVYDMYEDRIIYNASVDWYAE